MENMDKGLNVPKWVLINWPKIPHMSQNVSAQANKFWISMKKGFIGRPLSVDVIINFVACARPKIYLCEVSKEY